jgi:selenide,water dikinase
MAIDLEKRRRIMQRSVALGHCICNPKQACPCDTFKQKDVCPCAGERLDNALEQVALTSLVAKAGCASKINQNDLKRVLAGLPEVVDPNLLVGSNTCDDAGVYKLDNETALVQTVDVFSPVVDDPYTFGQIAAANSLSDVYAMGGRPLTALSVIGFPIETVDHRAMTQMLRGGLDKMREAGVAVVGGHSINDHEPKFGYAVTGLIDPARIIANSGAKPGDVLVLTKPLGVGVISFASQCGLASDEAVMAASAVMTELNKTAAEVMIEVGVSAATDVTGFGLLGHLGEMAVQSGVDVEIVAPDVPLLDGVIDYIHQGAISGGCERNKEHSGGLVDPGDVPEQVQWALYDPQTSGGLLISVPIRNLGMLMERLIERGITRAAVIGEVTGPGDGRIVLKNTKGQVTKGGHELKEVKAKACCCGDSASPSSESACCANPPGEAVETAAEGRFMDFMGTVNSEGAIPVRTKELIAIALSVAQKCEPCIKIHINKARKLGISQDEIDEAVWMGISFGGAPTMMFYKQVMGE